MYGEGKRTPNETPCNLSMHFFLKATSYLSLFDLVHLVQGKFSSDGQECILTNSIFMVKCVFEFWLCFLDWFYWLSLYLFSLYHALCLLCAFGCTAFLLGTFFFFAHEIIYIQLARGPYPQPLIFRLDGLVNNKGHHPEFVSHHGNYKIDDQVCILKSSIFLVKCLLEFWWCFLV